MLQLKNIVKNYKMGDMEVHALRDIDLEFGANDFVSILGPSGCGKTTMLNIIGGLDRYTSGDLVINGVSTKEYKDYDWDIYRNKSIGFVFQTYNLISHQSVYSNVELALTLSGISAKERKDRVIDVLEKVGLGDQIKKKPTQLSGGQMQRVAIARALINDPDILLADEPTGALDSETSIQIMELLKEIAEDRLVIMVTHNPELAKKYSTRIIGLVDGLVDGDVRLDTECRIADESSQPKTDFGLKADSRHLPAASKKRRRKKTFMSYWTAVSLSMKNLLTKKTRTILTAFAGSIGIIGIALILSLSSGMQDYVNNLERDTLSTYPLEISSQSMDLGGMIASMHDRFHSKNEEHAQDGVYSNNIMTNMIEAMTSRVSKNDLPKFKKYVEDSGVFKEHTNNIQYGYDIKPQIFMANTENRILQVNPSEVMDSLSMGNNNGNMGMSFGNNEIWSELLDNRELLEAQYDVVAGAWPESFDEIVVILNDNNELSDITLYSLGLLDPTELENMLEKARRGEKIGSIEKAAKFSYNEILATTFKLLVNANYYEKDGDIWVDKREVKEYMRVAIDWGTTLKITGIIKPKEDVTATAINGSVGYLSSLTEFIINKTNGAQIVKEQIANPDINVFNGISFDIEAYLNSITMKDVEKMVSEMPQEEQMMVQMMTAQMTEKEVLEMFRAQIKVNLEDEASYEKNIEKLGVAELNKPSVIRFYPKGFDAKKEIERLITEYNDAQEYEEDVINYTDIVGIMTNSISNIINIISYVLIAFVAISLVVSSIMIAIITYISVLERTKEIGILRSLGASKKDITRVFNAETIIEGFVAGLLGILITILLNIPINAIIVSLTDIRGIAQLPLYGAIGLIIISVFLTLLAGFIPSKMAAKRDPVVALRTE